jgi:hypothetical protein
MIYNMRQFHSDPKWQVLEEMDKESLFVNRTFFYGKDKCHKIKLDSKLIKNYEGYLLIDRDIKSIVVWLKLLKDHLYKLYGKKNSKVPILRIANNEELPELTKALYVSCLTIYGKLFNRSEGRNAKLECKIFAGHNKFLSFHNELMEQRHNFAAHSGKVKIENANVYLVLDPVQGRNEPLIISDAVQPDSPYLENIELFQSLISFLKTKVDEKLVKSYNKLNSNISEMGIDFWYSFINHES